jgi:hypothetical protein
MMEWETFEAAIVNSLRGWDEAKAVIIAGSFNPSRVVRQLKAMGRTGRILIALASSRDGYLPDFETHIRSWKSENIWVVGNNAHNFGCMSIDWSDSNANRVLLSEPVDASGGLQQAVTAMMVSGPDKETGPLEDTWNGTYVGNESCRACHQPEYQQWYSTKHAHAFETLEARQRQNVAACVKCHVVGFGATTGFTGQLDLRGVGCENCHGPGGDHVLQPTRSNVTRPVRTDLCMKCHDSEHSDFKPESYLQQVVHQ